MRPRTLLIVLAAGAGLLGFAAGKEALAKYEEPKFEVLRKEQDIEIRQYPAVIAAEVVVSGTKDKAANQAFRILAGYIFGKNVARDKIAMTVPVTETKSAEKIETAVPAGETKSAEKMETESPARETKSAEKIAMTVPVTETTSDGAMTMRFFMPSQFTLESLPEAVDKRIKFAKLPPVRYAVIKFSGMAQEDNISKHESKLRKFLKDQGITAQEPPVRAFYNPPWTLPFLRRNEVWLQIENL